ncbi:MAG: SpoIVB peptidase [Butyricicoccus sp.]|nr:SpoIVB peptidase [Butyricicoccus sp.]
MKRKLRRDLACGLFAVLLSVSSVFAAALPETLIPVGRAVGIRLHTEGVMIAEIGTVETARGTVCPAEEAGLQAGDAILEVDGKSISSNVELQQIVERSAGETLSMLTKRGGEERVLKLQPARDLSGQYRLGVMIRDGMSGIGTLTFVDPETGAYGSLGHGICDGQNGALLPLETGDLIRASVERVQKGEVGDPGALQGSFDESDALGTVEQNTENGIFGVLDAHDLIEGLPEMPTASAAEIRTGPCTILSNVAGTDVREYTAEITKVFRDGGEFGQCMMLQITDEALKDITGGIVQGMSGSSIIQDGKLVGAVTHVLVNDPTRGYGIFIENMLEAAG